jgi:hypothetical protein
VCVQRQISAREVGERERENRKKSKGKVQLFAAVAAQGELPGADLSVVLCELDKGFESLWISNQRGSIR